MATETNLSELKINYLTETQYAEAKTNNQINDDELYMTPDNSETIFDLVYPVGSIYMSVNNTDPSTLFGGTWVSWGAGRVPVGVDTSDNDFSTVEKTGGEKTHTLTINEMPSHYHGLNTVINGTNPGGSSPYRIQTDKYQWGGTGVYTGTDLNGSSQPHNNIQPYITCYMWKRTE